MSVTYETRDGVAVLTLQNPPVNGLGLATRRGLLESLARALDDAEVKAVVVTGGARAFSGGADIREFNTPQAMQEPSLPTVISTRRRPRRTTGHRLPAGQARWQSGYAGSDRGQPMPRPGPD